jgi:hypothetical protein
MGNINIDQAQFTPVDAPILADEYKKYKTVQDIFTNNGYMAREKKFEDGKTKLVYGRMSFQDMIMTGDLLRYVPKVVTTILQGSIQPRMVISNKIFKTVNIGSKISVNVGRFGPMMAYEQPEGAPWKRSQIHLDGGEMMQPVRYKKMGVEFAFSDESKTAGAMELLTMMISEAGKALARAKEDLCMDTLEVMGADVYNNITPADGYFGATTGRNTTGAWNGSFSLNDLIYMTNYLTMRGFSPNTMLMHPLSWMVFATSPDTREIVTNGNAVQSAPTPMGDGADTYSNPFQQFGINYEAGTGSDEPDSVFGKIGYNPFVQTLNPLTATWHYRSKYLPTGMDILVSPFVKYTLDANADGDLPTCNLHMVDANEAGVILQADKPAMRDYKDFMSESTVIRLGEIYGTEILRQGEAIATAKGVVVDRNFVFDNVNSVTLTEAHPGNTPLATA